MIPVVWRSPAACMSVHDRLSTTVYIYIYTYILILFIVQQYTSPVLWYYFRLLFLINILLPTTSCYPTQRTPPRCKIMGMYYSYSYSNLFVVEITLTGWMQVFFHNERPGPPVIDASRRSRSRSSIMVRQEINREFEKSKNLRNRRQRSLSVHSSSSSSMMLLLYYMILL